MNLLDIYRDLHIALRILIIAALAMFAAFAIQVVRRGTRRLVRGPSEAKTGGADFARRYPKLATVTSLVASAVTFAIFFVALGLILSELHISLTAYLATASVVGLAVGFGSQGLVQDVVIGLTLVFSDAMDLGDMVEISGQVGLVDQIGLRFTTLTNLHGGRIYIPNRNINLVGRYPGGSLRARIDVQMPSSSDEAGCTEDVMHIVRSLRSQHPAIIRAEPIVRGVQQTAPNSWRYLRIEIRLWPGQQALLETGLRQRLLTALRQRTPDYPDWMITITYASDHRS